MTDYDPEVTAIADQCVLLGLVEPIGVNDDGEMRFNVNMERFEEVEKAVMFVRFLLDRVL